MAEAVQLIIPQFLKKRFGNQWSVLEMNWKVFFLQDSANGLLDRIVKKELNPDQLTSEVEQLGLHERAKVTYFRPSARKQIGVKFTEGLPWEQRWYHMWGLKTDVVLGFLVEEDKLREKTRNYKLLLHFSLNCWRKDVITLV